MVLDVRRGDGPPPARDYTFPALVTTEKRIAEDPASVRAAIRALMQAQQGLRQNVARATEVGRKRFPPAEADLIAALVERDLPFYDPVISEHKVARMNRFAQDIGLLREPVPYEQVVAIQFMNMWTQSVPGAS